MKLHPIQWRWHAEELMRLRRSDEARRYAAPQRAGRIDPNPHQIDAVVFALSRLAEGGCILADEVGLGKTIEAGLVIAQLRAEGARRVLLITPKPLVGQWRQELYTLFGVEAKDGAVERGAFEDNGVFLIGREIAGSERGKNALLDAPPFDLVVIDEAHEVFAGLHRRFDRDGGYRDDAPAARTAGRVYELISASAAPVLLLTATPIQNSLTELWALVRYVDPSGTLLGDLRTFRETFCEQDDRTLAEGQAHELRRRIQVVLKRTLRRQAQEFLSKPFVGRQAQTFEYSMSEDEKLLYEDVTRYLLEPNLAAFRGNQRRLLLIAFHRRMASSTAALASSLEKVQARLERVMRGASAGEDTARELLEDLEQEAADLIDPELDAGTAAEPDPEDRRTIDQIATELERVRGFVDRARSLKDDGKSRALLRAIRLVVEHGRGGQRSGKVVVFTESVVTQNHLHDLLIHSGLLQPGEITLFRGNNDSARAQEALERWLEEVGNKLPPHGRPSRDVAIRLALVHEFATRSKVFVSTEAGAKGLNLQFCDTVVNYDLPWNPQRIEQRIGRCHRYGQTRDVTVVSFLAKDNETDRLLYEILSKKLDLFGTVLDATDAVLHRPGRHAPEVLASTVGAELETNLRRIWERARTVDEIAAELRELRDRIEEERRKFEDEHARTAGVIESRFDEEVRRVFLRRKEELPAALAELDADLERVVLAYLEGSGIPFEREQTAAAAILRIPPHPSLPGALKEGLTVVAGDVPDEESLHLAHPLVSASIETARERTAGARRVAFVLGDQTPPQLRAHRGKQGRFVLVRVRFEGLEPIERLYPIVLLDGASEPLDPSLGRALLLGCQLRDLETACAPPAPDPVLDDAIDELLFVESAELSQVEESRFERSLEQLERYIEDRLLLRRRERSELERRIEEARARRDAALSSEVREDAEAVILRLGVELEVVEAAVERLEKREDDTYHRCRERLHQRRYAPAGVERLFDVELVLE